MENNTINKDNSAEAEPVFELTPEQATGFGESGAAGWFNRKRVVMVLCITLAVVVGGGLIVSANASKKKKVAQIETANQAARSPADFLQSLRDRAANNQEAIPAADALSILPQDENAEQGLPAVTLTDSPAAELARQRPAVTAVPAPPPSGQTRGSPDPEFTARRSSLVPNMAGNLAAVSQTLRSTQAGNSYPYSGGTHGQSAADEYAQAALAAQNAAMSRTYGAMPDPYAVQNAQDNKQNFYQSDVDSGAIHTGHFLGDNAIWMGTMIPGILETGINTDLPGNVLARVTQNIYNSQSGRNLLIPQGTTLIARYNSSISYAQHRVQIVWDTLIRPDGFQVELEGMNSVDKTGMSGQAAVYHENWFEYLKAAGIVTMFSVANAAMTETAAHYSTGTAAAVAESNSNLVNQLGGNMVARAMNIQPTLTVNNGTIINIMLNKTLYLPPVKNYPVTQKYVLE